ncbi:MAG: cupin domain-containing protein [Fusobacterium sp.]|uniref:cupin domain-containing protein n=1 Tax=Fusobacterium sp. TaxID=68766 RepID=UPI0026DD8E97|nr:cupin domain-containing protein [Fusobacterium sp.]MDO4689885.1 cupin domain-containing protein [Fusobacterium sp.]
MLKIKIAQKIDLNEIVLVNESEVVSMRAINHENTYLSLFTLASAEEITAEAMCGERYYYCFSGRGAIIIENVKKEIRKGEFLRVDKNKDYSLKSFENFKFIEVGEKIGGNDMENKMLKGLNYAETIQLEKCIEYQENKIVSKNLVAKKDLVITVMSFWKGENLEPHMAPGDALVTVLDGEGKFVVDGKASLVKKEESIVLPGNIAHAVEAISNFKMLLILIK